MDKAICSVEQPSLSNLRVSWFGAKKSNESKVIEREIEDYEW